MRQDEYFVRTLLVPPEEAKQELERCIKTLLDGPVDDERRLIKWFEETQLTLESIFMDYSRRYFDQHSGFQIEQGSRSSYKRLTQKNFIRARGVLNRIIDLINETQIETGSARKQNDKQVNGSKNRDVFIVHGHDEKSLLKVKEVLRSQNLTPIVLKDEPNGGATIIEKFEKNADVGFAVVLFSADDVGAAKNQHENLKPRARQNVVLELGYFIGRLTRARICALNDDGVELPSDIHGVVYTPLDIGGAWRYKLLDELKYAGYPVDKNKL